MLKCMTVILLILYIKPHNTDTGSLLSNIYNRKLIIIIVFTLVLIIMTQHFIVVILTSVQFMTYLS